MVLIFSQTKGSLDALENSRNVRASHMDSDGSVRSNDEQPCVDRFMGRLVFLLCTRAGGISINQSKGDMVIISDCNGLQNDRQVKLGAIAPTR